MWFIIYVDLSVCYSGYICLTLSDLFILLQPMFSAHLFVGESENGGDLQEMNYVFSVLSFILYS